MEICLSRGILIIAFLHFTQAAFFSFLFLFFAALFPSFVFEEIEKKGEKVFFLTERKKKRKEISDVTIATSDLIARIERERRVGERHGEERRRKRGKTERKKGKKKEKRREKEIRKKKEVRRKKKEKTRREERGKRERKEERKS